MQVWNLLHAARWKHRTQKVAKNRHLGTIAQLCRAMSSQLRHVSTIGKKLVKQQWVLHMSSQYGELRPTSGWDRFGSLGHPYKFQRVLRLGSVTARHLVVGVSQTLRCWTEGATYVRQGDHQVGHWPTFLVIFILQICKITQYANFIYVPLCMYTHIYTGQNEIYLNFFLYENNFSVITNMQEVTKSLFY